jgi:hypothetical protein
MSQFPSVPQRRANWHDPQWTRNSIKPDVSRKKLAANRRKMAELIRRAQCGEVAPIMLALGQTTIESEAHEEQGGDEGT